MKVGIMSMQRIVNYGSFLQALSLKNLIESLGDEVVFVDYRVDANVEHRNSKKKQLENRLKQYKAQLKRQIKSAMIRTGAVRLRPGLEKKWQDKYRKFLDNYHYLGMTERYRYRTAVDTLVIGSDEVFNCLQGGNTVGYSLELFGKGHRAKRLVTYAASFGSATLEKLQGYGVDAEVGECLKKFDLLSVRDANSAAIVQTLTGETPEQHLDPVLVGGVEEMDWEDVALDAPYMVVYGYANRFTEEEGESIASYAREKGLITVALCEPQSFCDTYIEASPAQILPYIRSAACVVTDTFHGTIFSTVCHRDVAVFCRHTGAVTNAQKLLDLLEKLGLENKLVKNPGDLSRVLDDPADFTRADELRSRERQRTLEYLQRAIHG